MDHLSHAQTGLREMDEMAMGTSGIHKLHPLCKLIVTITYIFVVVSFHKYDFSGLIVMALVPVLLFQAAEIPQNTALLYTILNTITATYTAPERVRFQNSLITS